MSKVDPTLSSVLKRLNQGGIWGTQLEYWRSAEEQWKFTSKYGWQHTAMTIETHESKKGLKPYAAFKHFSILFLFFFFFIILHSIGIG